MIPCNCELVFFLSQIIELNIKRLYQGRRLNLTLVIFKGFRSSVKSHLLRVTLQNQICTNINHTREDFKQVLGQFYHIYMYLGLEVHLLQNSTRLRNPSIIYLSGSTIFIVLIPSQMSFYCQLQECLAPSVYPANPYFQSYAYFFSFA